MLNLLAILRVTISVTYGGFVHPISVLFTPPNHCVILLFIESVTILFFSICVL